MTTVTPADVPQLLQPDGRRYDFASVCAAPRAVHEQLFQRGTLPHLLEIAGWQYQGWNLSFTAVLLGIRRFTKGLQSAATDGLPARELRGYNLWIEQTGDPDATWIPSSPHRHGFYRVSSATANSGDDRHRHALLLDYSRGGNPWFQLARVLRDYVVQVYPDDPRLLIGKAYVALGGVRVFGGNFVMRRTATPADDRPLT